MNKNFVFFRVDIYGKKRKRHAPEFPGVPCRKKEKHLLSQVLWWTIQESNLLPPVRQTGALAK